jgi:hypothetical protein
MSPTEGSVKSGITELASTPGPSVGGGCIVGRRRRNIAGKNRIVASAFRCRSVYNGVHSKDKIDGEENARNFVQRPRGCRLARGFCSRGSGPAVRGFVVRHGRGRYDLKASVRRYCEHTREIAAGRESRDAEAADASPFPNEAPLPE